MTCPGLETITDYSIKGFLSYPNYCYPQFWAIIMGTIFIILAGGLFLAEKKRIEKADFISSAGVSAIAVMVLSLIGTGVGFIPRAVFIEIMVAGIIVIILWFLKD